MLIDIHEEETLKFLRRIEQRPRELRGDIRLFASSIILRVAYGYVPVDHDDPMVLIALKALNAISAAGTPGRWFVDIFPSCTIQGSF